MTREQQFSFDFHALGRVAWESAGRQLNHAMKPPASFFVDDRAIANEFGKIIEPRWADLVDIAASAHIADRLARRSAGRSRQIKIRLPVRVPELWQSPEINGHLTELLQFMTQDLWSFDFCESGDRRRNSELQDHLPLPDPGCPSRTCLLSGGLDSFAGAAAAITANPGVPFVLVSITPNSRHQQRQSQQVKALRQIPGARLSHIQLPLTLRDGDTYSQEPTRRTRGLVFLALGSVTAAVADAPTLSLFENGWGALNLPYDRSQIGSDMSRSAHPTTLEMASQLLTVLRSTPFKVRNECFYQTKAEMLMNPAVHSLKSAIQLTFSCDKFPRRIRQAEQCGLCTSCLLRRNALGAAGLAECDSRDYRYISPYPPSSEHRENHAIRWQTMRMERCLAQPNAWLALVTEFPELSGAAASTARIEGEDPARVEARIVRLLRRQANHWRRGCAFGAAA